MRNSAEKTGTGKKRRFLTFAPILAGATIRERLIACLGALVGIACTGLICKWVLGQNSSLPLVVAPLGASAVLLFAVPASPLAQPWSIIGGNTISALVGVIVAHVVQDQILAIGFGVSLAILAMSFTRSLHPPGGAAALTAIIGGPAVTNAGFLFPFVPVALNCVLLVGLGYLFHKASGRGYPHVQAAVPPPRKTSDLSPEMRAGFRGEDIDHALGTLNETFDITREDLDKLIREVEHQAVLRSHGTIACADIMSRDVIRVALRDSLESARLLLLDYNIRVVPVVNDDNQLAGTIGLREIAGATGDVGSRMSPAATAFATTPVMVLIPTLTDGQTHAVIIVDDNREVVGIVTQTDLLAAMAKLLPVAA
jgi:CBS domain-containing membrane protein